MADFSKDIFDHYEAHYSRISEQYFKSLQEIEALHLDRLPRWLNLIDKEARILDAGCANGYLLGLLHEAGYPHLTGVDISVELTESARTRLADKAAVHQADVFEFLAQCEDETYDAILFHHVVEHIPREKIIPLLEQFRRCLKKGGYLSLRTPNAASLLGGYMSLGDLTHVIQFNEISMLQALEHAGFDHDKIQFIHHEPLLFWSWKHPKRAVLRLLNRLRWHLNRLVHRALCVLADVRPMPKVFEREIDVLAQKQ